MSAVYVCEFEWNNYSNLFTKYLRNISNTIETSLIESMLSTFTKNSTTAGSEIFDKFLTNIRLLLRQQCYHKRMGYSDPDLQLVALICHKSTCFRVKYRSIRNGFYRQNEGIRESRRENENKVKLTLPSN